MDASILKNLENLRNRLQDMVRGDTNVNVGILLHTLDSDIGKLGGVKKNIPPLDYFFERIE
jgi:hypothetical protein